MLSHAAKIILSWFSRTADRTFFSTRWAVMFLHRELHVPMEWALPLLALLMVFFCLLSAAVIALIFKKRYKK